MDLSESGSDSIGESSWLGSARANLLVGKFNLLEKFKGQKSYILDYGCGTGETLIHLSNLGLPNESLVGYDPFLPETMKHSGLEFLNERRRIEHKRFDYVLLMDVAEHVKDPTLLIQEAASHLVKDGILIVTVPAFQKLWSQHDIALGHERRYNRNTLTKVITASSGLRINWINYCFPILLILSLPVKIGPAKPEKLLRDSIKFEPILKLISKIDKILGTNKFFGLSVIASISLKNKKEGERK